MNLAKINIRFGWKIILPILFLITCLKATRSIFDLNNPTSAVTGLALIGQQQSAQTAKEEEQVITSGSVQSISRSLTSFTLSISPPLGMTGAIVYKLIVNYPSTTFTEANLEAMTNSSPNVPIVIDNISSLVNYTVSNLEPYQFYRVDIQARDSNNKKIWFPHFCIQMNPNFSGTTTCKDDLSGIVSTVAGTGILGGANGSFNTATFNQPDGIVALGNSLYVSDTSNATIRKLDLTTQTVTTVAGLSGTAGFADGVGNIARFSSPQGLTTDGTFVYVVDRNNHSIRKIDVNTNTVSTFAGTNTMGFTNATGTAARFNAPNHMLYDGSDFYLIDEDNCAIRKITPSAVVTAHAGSTCGVTFNSTLLLSRFSLDMASIVLYKKFLYITDPNVVNNNIRKVDTNPAGSVTTFTNVPAPHSAAVFGKNLYVSDNTNHRIMKFNLEDATSSILVGTGSTGSADGTGTNASLNLPRSMTFVGSTLYFCDTNNHKIRKIE
ncbi:MAG: hypothetical protein SFU98_16620 [Leptospiraceae bacterium]|nr:hypothetical protein [Leptospiraceae bacterium]